MPSKSPRARVFAVRTAVLENLLQSNQPVDMPRLPRHDWLLLGSLTDGLLTAYGRVEESHVRLLFSANTRHDSKMAR